MSITPEIVVQSLNNSWETASQVADKMGIRAANVGAILKNLAKKGQIQHRWVVTPGPRTGIKRKQEYRVN